MLNVFHARLNRLKIKPNSKQQRDHQLKYCLFVNEKQTPLLCRTNSNNSSQVMSRHSLEYIYIEETPSRLADLVLVQFHEISVNCKWKRYTWGDPSRTRQ